MNFSLISPTEAPCCDDQSDLTTGYHADTDLQALFVGVAHDLCAQSAADDLGGNGNQHQQEHKDDQLAGQTVQCHGKSDVGEEDGGEKHVGEGVEAVDHVFILFQTGYGKAGNESTGDICDTEEQLCGKGEQQAENKGDDVVALEVLVAGFPPFFKEEVYRTAAPIATMKNARMLMTTAKMPSPTKAERESGRFASPDFLPPRLMTTVRA